MRGGSLHRLATRPGARRAALGRRRACWRRSWTPTRSRAGRIDFDAVGHYARPDVFRLEVDERPMPAVSNLRLLQPSG